MQLLTFRNDSTTPAGRGNTLGRAHAVELRATASLYLDFFRHLGLSEQRITDLALDAHQALRDWRPLLAEELEATAAAAGLRAWEVQAVNARTEILAAAGASAHECSTLATVVNGRAATMQTWDWHAALVPAALLHAWSSDAGLLVKSFTEFGAQAKIGVNSAGMGLHFNILSHSSDSGEGGVPVHSIARAVLDEARSLEDARAIAESAQASASSSLTLVEDASQGPRIASLEISPLGVDLVGADNNSLLHTNHFLAARPSPGDTIPSDSRTQERYLALEAALARAHSTGAQTAEDLAAALAGPSDCASSLCFHPDPAAAPENQWDTLLTISLRPQDGELEASASHPSAPDFLTF